MLDTLLASYKIVMHLFKNQLLMGEAIEWLGLFLLAYYG